MKHIDKILNSITMYRLVVYVLALIATAAFVFSATGVLGFSFLELLTTFIVVMVLGFVTNTTLSQILKIPANSDSGLITSLIIFLLVRPSTDFQDLSVAALVTVIAIASKFFVTYKGKHIFNPAAFGFVAIGVMGIGQASWWVGSQALAPFIAVGGFLVARKIRRLGMVTLFVIAAGLLSTTLFVSQGEFLSDAIRTAVLVSPLLFLGGIMLTEPSTMPPRRWQQYGFALIIAVLYALHPGEGRFYVFPETALVIGNLIAFGWSPKRRWLLTFVRRKRVGTDYYDYEFKSNAPLSHTAGQYAEVTAGLPLAKLDDRGNRRTFTIASSPLENTVHFGVRMPSASSSFKQWMTSVKPGAQIILGQPSGDFVLPKDTSKKLLAIAGGVGVTPFRSMAADCIANKQTRDIVLLYLVRNHEDAMYLDIFEQASSFGFSVQVIVDTQLTTESLRKLVPDMTEREVYIAGSEAMVSFYRNISIQAGVRRRAVHTDHFSGY